MESESNGQKPLAVITGASSSIGYHLAHVFAENGFDLFVNSGSDKIFDVVHELEEAGAKVTPVKADLSKYEGVEELWKQIEASSRPIAAIAINAGVGVGGDFARETDLQQELSLIQLNVTSAVHLAKYVTGEMVKRREGRIRFTSSIAGTMPTPLEAVYGASKAFLLSFAESLRHELEGTGATVTVLQPGPTATNFFHRAGLDDTKVGSEGKFTNDQETTFCLSIQWANRPRPRVAGIVRELERGVVQAKCYRPSDLFPKLKEITQMKTIIRMLQISALLIAIFPATQARAQEHRWNANIGAGFTPLIGAIGDRLDNGWHVTFGGGYNVTDMFSVGGQVLYNGFGVNQNVLVEANVPGARAHLWAFTVEPRLRLAHSRRKFVPYLVGGVGYYRRTLEFTQPTIAPVTIFDPFFGFGTILVPADEIIGSVVREGIGGNAGFGFEFGLGHTGAKLFTEARFHYTDTGGKGLPTRMIPWTVGVRF